MQSTKDQDWGGRQQQALPQLAETNIPRPMDVAGDGLLYNNNKSESACTNMGIIAIPSILEYDVPIFHVGTKRKTNRESEN